MVQEPYEEKHGALGVEQEHCQGTLEHGHKLLNAIYRAPKLVAIHSWDSLQNPSHDPKGIKRKIEKCLICKVLNIKYGNIIAHSMVATSTQ